MYIMIHHMEGTIYDLMPGWLQAMALQTADWAPVLQWSICLHLILVFRTAIATSLHVSFGIVVCTVSWTAEPGDSSIVLWETPPAAPQSDTHSTRSALY